MFLAEIRANMLMRVSVLTVALATLTACSSPTPVSPTLNTTTTVTVTTNSGSEMMVVSGRVYAGSDVSDLPLGDADVVIVTGTTTAAMRTGSKGYYTLAVPPGAATITASKKGYSSKTWSLDLANNLVLNFSLASE